MKLVEGAKWTVEKLKDPTVVLGIIPRCPIPMKGLCMNSPLYYSSDFAFINMSIILTGQTFKIFQNFSDFD